MTAPLILIVEDETRIADVLVAYLGQAGYRTQHVADGLAVLPALRAQNPALVLLDLMLPGKDGMTLCREIRQQSHVPIIMVTARVEEIDRLLGLEFGADDYICKPFSPREVVARVKTVLRRAPAAAPVIPSNTVVERGPFQLDSERFEASIHGQLLELTPKEFRLLEAFLAHPGRVFSRAQLLDQLYHAHEPVSDRMIDSHIKNLRRKIAQHLGHQDVIQAVYGVGYKLVW